MIDISKFPFKKQAFFSILAVGLCFMAGESLAQSDRDKMDMDNTKPMDRPIVDHTSEVKDNSLRNSSTQPVLSINREKIQPVKKEGNISGEGKKTETAPSTLSFNIFLYIVDKFKAD